MANPYSRQGIIQRKKRERRIAQAQTREILLAIPKCKHGHYEKVCYLCRREKDLADCLVIPF